MKYIINQQLVEKLEAKLSEFKHKLSENVSSLVYEKSEPYHISDTSSDKYGEIVVDVEIDAKYKVGDYQFICVLEWNDEANENLILKASDDIYVPAHYKTRRECDHCRTHRYRKTTVLLKSTTKEDEYIQVGRSCVKDFIGVDLGNYAYYLSLFDTLDEYLETCKKKESHQLKRDFDLDIILQQSIEETRRNSYISKSQSYELGTDSTSSRVWMALTKFIPFNQTQPLYQMYDVTPETICAVQELKEFFNTLEEDEITDYTDNIKTLLKTQWIDAKNVGIVVSAVGTKLRIQSQRKAREVASQSHYVGEIGEKVTFRSKPVCIYSAENMYGVYRIYKMVSEGNELVWKTTKWLDPDTEYEFSATVKAHEEYRGIKQTEITRARTK